MKSIGPTKARRCVTDHAIIRYIERVAGIDLDFVAQEIMNVEGVYPALRMGAEGFTKDGVEYRMSGGRIVTLINHNEDEVEVAA